jgi:polar amino acid transport system substrate-binding protein
MQLRGWVCAFLFPALAAFAAAPGPVLVDVDEANPPFMFGSNGNALGLYPRLIGAAFRRLNVPVQIEAKPWKRALAEIENGTAGVGGLYKNPERLTTFDYSEPLFVETLVVYCNRDRPVAFRRMVDLKGKRIGVLRGWSYGDGFDSLRRGGTCRVEEVASDEQNFHKLASKRLDVVIAVRESGAALMTSYKDIDPAATPLARNPTYLAFAKSAHRSGLLKQFDGILKEMQKSGEFQKIVAEELAK